MRRAKVRRRLGPGAVLFVAAWAAAASCTGEATPPAMTSSTGPGASGGGGSSHSSTSTTSAGGGAACPPQPLPPDVPPGWVEWTDWSCDCRFYVPGSVDVMPPPIVWETCPGDADGSCERMATPWTTSATAVAVNRFDAQQAPPLIMFRRVSDTSWTDLVAEVDGVVRTALVTVKPDAIFSPGGPGCYPVSASIGGGRYAYGVHGHDMNGSAADSLHEGAFGGQVDDPTPTVLAHYTDDRPRSWYVSGTRVVRVEPVTWQLISTPWAMTPESLVTKPGLDPDGLHVNQILPHGDALFYSLSTLVRSGIDVWTPAEGTRPFIRWVGSITEGAADLGTDGSDLVWSYGERDAAGPEGWATRSIMTAPFTTDPVTVNASARRLRSFPYTCLGCQPFAVGCGYAANLGTGNAVLLVRLADGVSWLLPGVAPGDSFSRPFGITCDHVYVLGQVEGSWTIVRERLDALGPGIAPD